jgi:hypothetical protein
VQSAGRTAEEEEEEEEEEDEDSFESNDRVEESNDRVEALIEACCRALVGQMQGTRQAVATRQDTRRKHSVRELTHIQALGEGVDSHASAR